MRNYMKRLNLLINFLKHNSFKKEYKYILKIANQINDALDPKPFEIRMPQEIKVLEGMSSDATESCQLVNFGIEVLQKPGIAKNMKKATPFFPEEINFIHFDLMKLVKCIDINEKSYNDFVNMIKAFGGLDQTMSYTKDQFLNYFDSFKYIQKAFKERLSNDKMNYVLLGTSDTSKNFFGTEVGAQLFHQNTIKHVIHDLGHASYDLSSVGRRKFNPFNIIFDYLLLVLKEFNKYLEMAGLNIVDYSDTDRRKARSKTELADIFDGSMNNLVQILRSSKKYYDIRYLVGTSSYIEDGVKKYKPKMFTDKIDYDQDIFTYILMSKSDKVSDIFKEPVLPPRMKKVFDKIGNPSLKERFLSFVRENHKKMIQEVQKDLEKVKEEHGGYATLLAKESMTGADGEVGEASEKVFVFNMAGPGFLMLEKELAERLSKKVPIKSQSPEQIYVGDKRTGRAFRSSLLIDSLIMDKNGIEGKMLFAGKVEHDRVDETLKRLRAFGEYRRVSAGETFYVRDEFIKEVFKNEFISQDDFSNRKKSNISPGLLSTASPGEQLYEVTVNDRYSHKGELIVVFYPTFDKSRIKVPLALQDPDAQKKLESLDVEKDFLKEDGDFWDDAF